MKSRAEWCNFLWKILVIGDLITKKLKYNRSCRIAYHDKAKAYGKKKWKSLYEHQSLKSKIYFMEIKFFVSNVLCMQEHGLSEEEIEKKKMKMRLAENSMKSKNIYLFIQLYTSEK